MAVFVRVATCALGVLVLVLQYRLWVGEGSLAHASQLQARVDTERAVNVASGERNRVLRAEIIELKRGPASVEARARSELGMIKPGETLFLIVED